MFVLLVAVAVVVVVIAVAAIASRLGVAGPLLLVAVGALASYVPGVPHIAVKPEIILVGVLPPLLYSSAVSMPAVDFRREFRAISALSVTLVLLSTFGAGLLMWWLLPEIGLATAIAIGAIVSPTDAVATAIARRSGASSSVLAVLEGESLLNDASALVVLRAAIAGTAGTVSVWWTGAQFFYGIAVAVAIGLVVGWVNLRVRRALPDAVTSTAVSFVVPFAASIPAEALGASGLVAAVTTGLVTGNGLARYLRPQQRISDAQNWRTIEFLLEGGIFLAMGFTVRGLVDDLPGDVAQLLVAVGLAAAIGAAVLLIRAGYVTVLLLSLNARARRHIRRETTVVGTVAPHAHVRGHERVPARRSQLLARPVSTGERAVVIWAGMRGAVTLAAAQTLPENTPLRPLLVVVAFLVAAGSLLLQGGTLSALIRRIRVTDEDAAESDQQRGELIAAMHTAGLQVLDNDRLRRPDGRRYDEALIRKIRGGMNRTANPDRQRISQDTTEQQFELRLAILDTQRGALLAARQDGRFSSDVLAEVLAALDAEQASIELKGGVPAQLTDAIDTSAADTPR